jgi:hypothetical protein
MVGNKTRKAVLMIELESNVGIIEMRNKRIKKDFEKIKECSAKADLILLELAALNKIEINPTNEPI